MQSFENFFRQATGWAPHGYQSRLARDGLPDVVQAPTGTGKTGIVLAWLYRLRHGPEPAATPRRLVYALPQRSLVEQVEREVSGWLDRLGLAEDVALHVVMGGEDKTQMRKERTQRRWRLDMHRPAIVVGTVDSLVSKALNRGYGISRTVYPIDFALVTNGAHWVIDEVQLCPESTTTLRQLAAFTASLGTAEPFGLTCMSATIPEGLLSTVDNAHITTVQRIEPQDRVGALATRLSAARAVRRAAVDAGDYGALASVVRERHRPGTLTLVVLNTVGAAKAVHHALREVPATRTLLHSRFRAHERQSLMGRLLAPPGEHGHIVVATQVVEAGMDLDADVLVTEAAPWPSVVQRAGRCNRRGLRGDAELWWLPAPRKAQPYPSTDLDAAEAALSALEGAAVTGEDLLGQQVAVTEPELSVLRRTDLLTLFDTAPDLSGADLDIAPYVRDAEDLDAQLAWAVWEPEASENRTANGRPPAQAKAPLAPWRCRVPLSGVADLVARSVPVWRFDQALGEWTAVTRRQPARPGEVLVVAAADGGYDVTTGFDAAVRRPVPDSPHLLPNAEPATGAEEAYREEPTSVAQRAWLSLGDHSEQTRDQARALVDVIAPHLPAAATETAVTAAYVHDVGKAHQTWQDALCRLAPPPRAAQIEHGRPWAKSDSDGRLRFEGCDTFRHELASLIFLDGPLAGLLSHLDEQDRDLARYLVLAHHGKLRVQVREPGEPQDAKVLLSLHDGETVTVPPVLGQPAGEAAVELSRFALGGEHSWTRTALRLRDRYGPFVLAYLETLVRIADWRASGQEPLPAPQHEEES